MYFFVSFLFSLAILYSRSVICLLNNLNRIFFSSYQIAAVIYSLNRFMYVQFALPLMYPVGTRYYLPYLPACCVFCSSSVSVIENNTQYFMIMLITLFEKTSVSAGFTRPLFIKWFDEVRTRSEQAIATILSEL